MTMVDGRLIAAPKVQFGQGEAKPGTSGRWDLKAGRFSIISSVNKLLIILSM
jgi:eukaryotic translation initiation factor 2C